MGLYISKLDEIAIKEERDLYIYLLDYGWPEGKWESVFKKHFMKMADLAADNNAVVIGSPRGRHFANAVLNYHQLLDVAADNILPAIMITRTHPTYFQDDPQDVFGREPVKAGLEDLLLVPLETFFTSEEDFIRGIEGIFENAKKGLELSQFEVAGGDYRVRKASAVSRFWESAEIKPGIFGLKLDVKKLAENFRSR